MLYNRIKMNASLDANGNVIPGEALANFNAMPTNRWTYVGQSLSKKGVYPYLLEDGLGNWELGHITVPGLNQPGVRTITDTNALFDSSTTGLVFSQVASAASALGCSPGAIPASAGADSIAAGHSAKVPPGTTGAVAIGSGAYAAANRSAALGAFSIAFQPGEAVLAASMVRFLPVFWWGGTAESGTPVYSEQGEPFNFGEYDILSGTRSKGVMRVRGTLYFYDDDTGESAAGSKVINLDYLLFINPSTSVATVLGTPGITVMHAGASAPNSTISIHTTRGVPVIATTAEAIGVCGVLEIHDFATVPSDSNGFTAAAGGG